jgi:serine protease Do
MTQTPSFSTQSSLPLPDAFSAELTALFTNAKPAIVQVYNEQRGGGTGVVWQEDGRILTNHHVVPSDQHRIRVRFPDGRDLEARVLQRNPQLDLAVLKIQNSAEKFQALPLGDSTRLRVGEWVFAVGHPWGQRWAVTAGIVSAVSTITFRQGGKTQYIKSDVRLAPGNSGGPLLNADGQVIGINAMIFGGDLSVSIPIHIVKNWLANLPTEQNQKRGRLGIEIQRVELPKNIQQQLHPSQETGLLVVSTLTRPDTLNNLLIGDILLAVAGVPVPDGITLRQQVAQQSADKPLPITLVRGGKVVTTNVALVA